MELSKEEVTPREPRQERSRRTFKTLLREADRLLPESGIAGFSMITLAERAKVNRSTAYGFFPTKYAVFNALAERYINGFLGLVKEEIPLNSATGWPGALSHFIDLSAKLYDRQPTARILFLGGAITPEIDIAHHETNNLRVARFMREVLESESGRRLPKTPDPCLIVVEAVIAVFSVSQRSYGKITGRYVQEAQQLANDYLQRYLS